MGVVRFLVALVVNDLWRRRLSVILWVAGVRPCDSLFLHTTLHLVHTDFLSCALFVYTRPLVLAHVPYRKSCDYHRLLTWNPPIG